MFLVARRRPYRKKGGQSLENVSKISLGEGNRQF